MAAFLASTGRCNYVQVSIDGSIPMTHDAMRGKGSFAKAVGGLMTLRRHGVSTSVRVTIHRKNVHDLEGVARFLLEEIESFLIRHQFRGRDGAVPEKCRDGATHDGRADACHGDPASVVKEIQRPNPGHGGAVGRGKGLARYGGGTARKEGVDVQPRLSHRMRLLQVESCSARRRGHHPLHDALPHRTGVDQPGQPCRDCGGGTTISTL